MSEDYPFSELLGLGYSGYAILNHIPIPLLPSSVTENMNLVKSDGSFSSDPFTSIGQLPAKQRKSLNISLVTYISPATVLLISHLTYTWRTFLNVDFVPEVPFTVVGASGEGYVGVGYVDEVTVDCRVEQAVTLTVGLTSWVWREVDRGEAWPRDARQLAPLSVAYKPLAFWQTVPATTMVQAGAIPQSWSLSLKNNWQYKTFLAGYLVPPNPGLVYPGQLDCVLNMEWVGRRRDRPLERGSARLQLGVAPQVLDTIVLDRVILDPTRQVTNVGTPNGLVNWNASYYALGAVPRSSV